MKQRLLLSLLMLMVSVGLVKAAVDITIPAGTGEVKIELSSDKFPFVEGSHPKINNDAITPVAYNTKTLTWNVKQTDKEQILGLSTLIDENNDWGNITIKITGKVSGFVSDNGPLTDQIVGIEFVNNGELSKLQLGASAAQTCYFPNLTSLSCSNNKLNVIPPKGKMTHYDVGMQSPADSKIPGMTGNAKSFVLKTEVFNNIFAANTVTDGKDLSIAKLVDEKGIAVPYEYDKVESVYHFRNAEGVFVDAGTYYADIKVNNESYPNVTICNVPLQVEAATFSLTVNGNDEHGNKINIAVNGTAQTGDVKNLKKGDVITLTPVPNATDGYEFDKFTSWTGITGEPKLEGNTYTCTVKGDVDLVIEAAFKLKDGVKVTWNTTTTDGEIKVKNVKTDKVLNSGDALTVGDEIRVYVKANEGKAVRSVTMSNINSTDIKDTDDRADVFDATVKVPAEGTNIVATFGNAEAKLTIKHPDGPASNTITIKDATGKAYGSQVNNDTNSDITADIPVGTKVTITFPVKNKEGKYVGSVLVNGTTIPTEQTTEGTYVIKDFEIKEAVTMTVNVTTLQELTVELDKNVTYTYNGNAQAVQYVVKNANGAVVNVSDIIAYYGGENDEVESFKANSSFTNAGTYKVYFYRPADEKYAEVKTQPVEYTIAKAPLVVNVLPTVSVDATTKKYKISGGKIGYMVGNDFKEVTGLGEFAVLDGKGGVTEDDLGTPTVSIFYKFKEDVDLSNYEVSAWDEGKNNVIVPVEGKDAETIKVSIFDNEYKDLLVLKNGGAVIESGDVVPVGSTITMGLTVEDKQNDNISYAVTITDSEGNVLSNSDNLWKEGSTFSVSKEAVKNISQLIFKLEVKDSRMEIKVAEASEKFLTQGGDEDDKDAFRYNGQPYTFDASKLTWVTTDGELITNTSINDKVQISYTIDGEVLTSNPVDAGTYTVTLTYDLDNYIVKPIQATLTIHKADFEVGEGEDVPVPEASQVGLGQKLDKSNLSGQATIEGSYEWDEEKDASQITVEANKPYKVKFVPTKNYKEAYVGTVTVPVTTNPVITFDPNPEGGKVTVVNKNDPNDVYKSGDEVFAGTELVIKATPNEDFEVASLKANGVGQSNPYTVKFDKTTIEIEATFRVKTQPGNFRVSIPDANDIRGAIISNGGEHVVAQGGSLSFTVSTLAADADKVRVTAGGRTLSRGTNGRYTLSNVQANTTVSISLSNPTEIEVDVPRTYLNKKDYHIGSVEIESDDDEFYYGDVITLIAFPESGVSFDKWSDGNKEQIRELTLTEDVALKAVFSGTPTGIEDIKSACILTGHGFIQIKNVANADLTIVSIAGRIQTQQRISGDVQIRVPQGVYVVVLESDGNVQRTKVIVR